MLKYIFIIGALFTACLAGAQSNKDEVDLMQTESGMQIHYNVPFR
jgi:hypothetical protein